MKRMDIDAAEVLPIIKARERLTSLPEELAETPGTVAVTRRGEPVLAILAWDLYESIVETLEVLSDEVLTQQLRLGIRQAAKGKLVDWESAKREFGW